MNIVIPNSSCEYCGAGYVKTSKNQRQKYCRVCSDLISKKKHNIRNQAYKKSDKHVSKFSKWKEDGTLKNKASARQEKIKQRGFLRSEKLSNISKWDEYFISNGYRWSEKIVIPWSKHLSKNSIWTHGSRNGHVFIRSEVRAVRNKISTLVKMSCAKHDIKKSKIWIGIFAQKPTAQGDAVNYLDLIADAIKDVMPVDDNFYSVDFIDWEIKKINPEVAIYIGQRAEHNHVICSYCGQLTIEENLSAVRTCKFCCTTTSENIYGNPLKPFKS
jgi:hypothetical protein